MASKSSLIGVIAQEAGCAPSTVSRVMNGCRKGFSVRPELSARIHELARELNYRPNPYLRALRARKTRILAVFEPLRTSAGVVQTAKTAFLEAIRADGYTESGKYTDPDVPESYTVPFPVDGALCFDIVDGECLNFVEAEKIPYVVVNGLARPGGASILVDEETDVGLLVDHLIARGHRDIAFYAGHKPQIGRASRPRHYSVAARETSYLETMAQRGLVPASPRWEIGTTPAVFLRRTVVEGRATAVICYDHTKTVELLRAAWELGLAIPRDVSVVSFNDEYPLAHLVPAITCVGTPGVDMGRQAAALLLDVLSGRRANDGDPVRIAGTLVERESVGPPPTR